MGNRNAKACITGPAVVTPALVGKGIDFEILKMKKSKTHMDAENLKNYIKLN